MVSQCDPFQQLFYLLDFLGKFFIIPLLKRKKQYKYLEYQLLRYISVISITFLTGESFKGSKDKNNGDIVGLVE